MAEQPPRNNDTGIIELFDYFKNGFKAIFKAIGQLFVSIWNVIISYLLLLKENLVFVAVCLLIFIGLYYFVSRTDSFKNYEYEMIVRPNFESVKNLESNINSLNFEKSQKTNSKFLNNLIEIEMYPLKSANDEMDLYFDMVDNDYSPNSYFKQENQRDTVFFRQVPLEDFASNLKPSDYTNFKIRLKTKSKFPVDTVLKYTIAPVENNATYQNFKKAYLDELNFKKQSFKQSLQLIDTMLLARSFKNQSSTPQDIITLSQEGERNERFLEKELLGEKDRINRILSVITTRQALNANVVDVLSQPKLVSPSRVLKRNLLAFLFYGLLFASAVLIGIRFWKYLNKIQKEKS